jgi:DNA polymerase-3 subunit delta
MVLTLTGNNGYLLKRRLDELVAEFVKKYGELAVERIDAEDVDSQVIFDAVQSQPFLSERKIVVVRDLGFNKSAAEAIEQIISSISESTDLVIYQPITDKRTAFYKALKTKTKLEEYAELDPHNLAKWLTDEAENQGAKLSLADANYLVERVGANQAMLASELQKLLIYSPQINRQNIDLLTEPTPQGRIFDLLDATFSGNKKKALELYEQQRTQKVEPQAILAMIGWQLRLIALAKHAGSRKSAQIAKDTGMNPYPINKAIGLADKISETRLNDMVSEALDIDYRGKSTSLDMDEALKTYITTL